MGLDIFIGTDKEIENAKFPNNLSRVFVKLILQQHDNNDEEINQIAQISGIDLSPVLKMNVPDKSYLLFQLDETQDESQIKEIKDEIEKAKEMYSQNIDLVIDTLQKLDKILKENPEYYKQLKLTQPLAEYLNYFKNYWVEIEPNEYDFISSCDINFGVDIWTLLNYLKYAKSQGAMTAYFCFG